MAEWQLSVADPGSRPFFSSGWSEDIEGDAPLRHRWTTQSTAHLTVPKPAASSRVALAVAGVPYLLPGRVEAQDVWVFVEGALAGFARMANADTIRCIVPESAVKAATSLITIAIVVPDAVVPAEVGVGSDQRRLGFALQGLTLTW